MNNILAARKLTDSETSKLRSLLKSNLKLAKSNNSEKQQAEEDAADLLDYAFAMIANGKNVGYVVEELKSMEMEVCDASSAEILGRTLANFLGLISENSNSVVAATKKHEDKNGGKPGGNNNALSSSGALVTSRVKKDVNNPPLVVGLGVIGGGGRGGSGGSGGRGRGNNDNRSRSLLGVAFDRLKPQDFHRDRNTAPQMRGIAPLRGRGGVMRGGRFGRGGERVDNSRAIGGGGNRRGADNQGRGGRGGRRGRHLSSSSTLNRDGRGGRGRNNYNYDLAGRRRGREDEEEEFIPADVNHGLTSGCDRTATYDDYAAAGRGRCYSRGRDRGMRGGARGSTGGRERGERKISGHQDHAKRPRRSDVAEIEKSMSNHWANNTSEDDGRGMLEKGRESSSSWVGGRDFHGAGRGGRGRSSRGGRGSNARIPNTKCYTMAKSNEDCANIESTGNATKEAAAVSESPLIAASFGHAPAAGKSGGRGGRGRGSFVSRGARGRGLGRGGRTGQSLTWKRPRTMDEGLATQR